MWRFVFAAVAVVASSPVGHAQNLVQRALDDPYFRWRSIDGPAARIYYQAGSFAEQHRHTLLRSVSGAIVEDLEYLGEPGYNRVLDVFYVDTREEMARIVGRPVTGYANWGADAIFLVVAPDWRSFEKHEFAHLITMGRWGPPHDTSRWMVEGICIAADGWCREFSVDAIAHHLLTEGRLPPFNELPSKIGELGEIGGGMYAASVIDFIRDTYGPEAVRELWIGGSSILTDTLGVPFDTIEAMWKEHLEREVEDGLRVDMERIEESGCG